MPRFCDIIMKGGITSGIVYPAAVYEIAKDFVFKNVGGTSAGAIAASLTAAAERRRAHDGSTEGFERVSAIPHFLATEHRLYRLFAPNSSTRSLYRTVVSLFGRPRFQPALIAKWCGLVWAYPVASLMGAVPGTLFLITVLLRHRSDLFLLIDLIAAVITILLGISVAIVFAFMSDVLKRLPHNAYGMVKGVDDADRTSQAALCTWLTQELELTAGLDAGKVPLTFGMLWDAKRDIDLPAVKVKPDHPDVNLEMITTNVTWGRPYQFPLDRVFFYDPNELAQFFPDHVIKWMTDHPRAPKSAEETEQFPAYASQGKLPIPLPADLPVIVATRMSLAFPILLSAVPLYAGDYSKPTPHGRIPELERCWFSDGGISSNFPVTLFDSPLPRWPTFAINLAPFNPAYPQQRDESKNVYMPSENGAGILSSFSRFKTLPGFLSAIVNAMQNWNDNTQTHLPGYRDRIVTVFLDDTKEGGLNLDMPPDVLERLRLRGIAAGALIAGRFKTPSLLPAGKGGMDWENHRWLRFRSTMGALRAYLSRFTYGFRDPLQPDVPYEKLILASDGTPVHHYPVRAEKRTDVDEVAKQVADLGENIAQLDTLDDRLPKPPPQLVLRGSLET
jgi:predicted acylesterase/phospholipase RssA